MAEINLTARTPLGGHDETIGACRMCEATETDIVSVAWPEAKAGEIANGIKVLGLSMPEPTMTNAADGARAVRTTPDQMLVLLDADGAGSIDRVAKALDGAGYLTRQTDAWVICDLSGDGVFDVLERLCPINIRGNAFPVGASARTAMEHMGALIIRTGETEFRLMSASSSARTFEHALTTSMRYVA